MKIEKGLNPNCSEIVFRFEGIVKEVDTADWDSLKSFLEEAVEELKSNYKKEELIKALKKPSEWGLYAKFYDNLGGGGSWEDVRRACWLATQVAIDKISLDEAKEMLMNEKGEMIEEEF